MRSIVFVVIALIATTSFASLFENKDKSHNSGLSVYEEVRIYYLKGLAFRLKTLSLVDNFLIQLLFK